MTALTQIVSRVVGGGRGTTGAATRRGATTPTRDYGRTGGARNKNEAIGRGVRGLLRRLR